MNILVIGSEGNIGSKLVPFLQELAHEVYTCDIVRTSKYRYTMVDIRNSETLKQAFECDPHLVIHLAGEVSRETSEHWANIAIDTNCIGAMNVIRHCLINDSKLLYTGTSEEYGALFADATPVNETMRPGKQRGIYGLTKWMAEELIEYHHDRYGLNAIIVRIFMCYGPGEVPNPYRSAVSRFIGRALKNEKIYVHEGTARSWCYYTDIIKGISAAAMYDSEFEIFNIGRDESWTIEALAEKIIYLTNSNSEIQLEPVPLGITPRKNASFKKAKWLLGWEAKVSFEEGIRETVEWNVERMKRINIERK